jgi:hypothetical protein
LEKQDAIVAFPNLSIEEIQIHWNGIEWFTQEDKKIIVCSFIP